MATVNELFNSYYNSANSGAAPQDNSVPVDNSAYDYTQNQQDYDNPYQNNSANNNSEANDQAQNTTPAETPKEPTQQPTQEQQPQQSFAQESLNNVLTQNGVTADEWSRITSPNFDIQGLMASTAPEAQKYRNAYMAYQNMMQTPAQQQPAPAQQTQTPAQQAPEQNPILPSAGGNYQADSIYDPSKTYGRQPDGSYVYSNSAAQLQRDLNRVMDAGLAVDGYFGEKTQQALDAYLKQYGKQTSPANTPATVETPISQNGSMSAALAASAAEAPKAPTDNATGSKKSGHDDAWYAEQYEKITGNAPRTDILSPERIKDFVDKELAKRPTTPEDEGYDAMLQQQALYQQAQEQQRINEMNARRDEAFTPKFVNDLRNGKSVEQILGEGDKSYNRWIEENWDDLSYTYNLGNQSPFGNQTTEQREPINYAAMLDELNQMDRNDWYQRPESQSTTQREPINYNAMADELAQLERNDWYQRPESQRENGTERTPINYDAMANELFQADRNDWYQRPETPQAPERTPIEYSDAFIRQQDMNDAYSPNQTFNDNYRAELERLQQPRGEVFGSQRNGSVPERYIAPRQPLEYSDAFIRQEEMKDAYSPYADYSGSMATDDIQSSGAASSEEQAMRDAYEAAMQSAGRARDIFNGLPTENEQIQQTREQWQQNQRNALEQQIGPYMKQFQKDYQNYRQQFPNYPDSAIMDMILMNEENNYGRSSYYNWLVNSLG